VAGQIFAGARIFYAFGREHRAFSALGVWNARLDAPIRSLLAQATITLLLAILFGTPLWNRLLGRPNIGVAEGSQAFEQLVYFTTPAVWFFYLMVGMALFRLRRTSPPSPDQESSVQPETALTVNSPTAPTPAFRVPFYPFTPILFCLSSVALLQSSLWYAFSNRSYEAFWSLGILAVGLVLARFSRRQKNNLPISSIGIDD
jgi:amino acid transporter